MAKSDAKSDSLAVEYLQSRIQQAKQEVAKLEKKLYEAETEYFSTESSQMGTLLKVRQKRRPAQAPPFRSREGFRHSRPPFPPPDDRLLFASLPTLVC